MYPRTVLTLSNPGDILVTTITAEQSYQSDWTHPLTDLLIFADSGGTGAPVTYHGGPVGSGLPIEALFWGDWWLSQEGADRLAMIVERLKAVIASPYFSELAQYGIQPPRWREARIVTQPTPPAAFNSTDDQLVVPDLIDDLIDDGVLPDPDDEQIANIVFMPKGFTQSINASGGHTWDFNYTFPFDEDYYWVGWVGFFDDGAVGSREDVMRSATHELVELMSDPEGDGWYAEPQAKGEIGDLAVEPTVEGNVKQTAFVNGAKVTAYWSNRHGAPVIPIDRDYAARLTGTCKSIHTGTEHGTFRPDPSESKLCDILPSCCLPNKDFRYTLAKYDDVAKIRVETQRYRLPGFAWTVEGKPVVGRGTVTCLVTVETFAGRTSTSVATAVVLEYAATYDVLELRAVGTNVNFDITVGCTVREDSITGELKVDFSARPSIRIGFQGVKLTLDPEYIRDREACGQDLAKMFNKVAGGNPGRPVHGGDGSGIDPGILSSVPAYARLAQFNQARRALATIRMGYAVLSREAAASLAAGVIADNSTLRAALSRGASGALPNATLESDPAR